MKAEKKAYEQVIRMIAHEVNNSVAGIVSAMDTVDDALQTIEETEDLREMLKVCIERSYGMSRFITNFADVVKIPEPQLEEACLNGRVEACKLLMENICQGRDIALKMELCEENPVVMMDTSLFEQVLIKIIKNAAESIGEGGEVVIRTSLSPLMLEVGDNGKGISKEVESRLFTPFFSTKPNGQGIGLIFIREVLMKHGCTFSLRTYPDGITRFRIFF
jgi:signal transduction histidine kinase